MRRNQRRNTVLIIQGKTVCPQTTEGNHKEVTDQRKTSTCYLLSLSELSLVLRCLWRFILTHPKEEKKKKGVDGDHQKMTHCRDLPAHANSRVEKEEFP